MSETKQIAFETNCRDCPRLSSFLDRIKEKHPGYHSKPVAPFGDDQSLFLIVGLAPGMHGANASGRPFTGDHAGILLYQTLYDFGFSNLPVSSALDDGLELINCRITNAVKCLPPQNKPLLEEIRTCNGYLRQEIDAMPESSVIMALGKIAHDSVLRAKQLGLSKHPFVHGKTHKLGNGLTLVDCYHCSRYNTQTRRLTPDMFNQVFETITKLLDGGRRNQGICRQIRPGPG
jgi:uracil-DNA glycosylase family 4